jgi:hypothetical protein
LRRTLFATLFLMAITHTSQDFEKLASLTR